MIKSTLSYLAKTRAIKVARNNLAPIVKVLITLGGILYIIITVPIDEIREDIHIESWSYVALALSLVLLGMFVRAYRWGLLLRGIKSNVNYRRLVELYFAGSFFNTFLPSGFGGDAVRIIEVARDVPASIAAGTVVVDRLTGIMALLILALAALPFRPDNFPQQLSWVVAFVSILGLLVGFMLLEGSLITRLGRWLPPFLSPSGKGPIAKLLAAVRGCGKGAIAAAFGASMLFNLLLVGWWVAGARALGHGVTYRYMILVVPILSISLLVPSINGIGVRESIAGPLFQAAGLATSTSVVLSLLVRVMMISISLLGGPIYLLTIVRGNRSTPRNDV